MAEESKTESKKQDDIELDLQLGDVIHIMNQKNENLNDQTFIIDYIDKSKTYLINTETFKRIKLIISDGILGDGNITQIEILSRADSPSFARQNELLPGKWIKITFSDPNPAIIIGEITNLEEDMIEIKTSDKDTIYINFDYKGIPDYLPIDNIEIIEKKTDSNAEEEIDAHEEEDAHEDQEADEGEIVIPEIEKEKKVVPVGDINFAVPIKDVKEKMREFIVRADQIKFGDEELGPISRYIDVSEQNQRYSIEVQVTDLLDDLLSTIPDSQRTPRVLNNIHIMIERFKQLRDFFSTKDQYGNIDGVEVKEATYKPLLKWLSKFNTNLYWILPVVKNVKKIYDVNNIDEENNDIVNLEFDKNIREMNELIENYRSNNLPTESNKYTALYSELAPYFRPFNYVDDENTYDVIYEKNVGCDINTVVDNLEDLYSSVFSNNMVRNRRFVITKYNLGDTKLDITDSNSSKMTTVRVKMTASDMLSIKSIMTLPEPTIRFSKINLPGTDLLTKANLNQVFLNYWELLKKKTNVSYVFVDTLKHDVEFHEDDFVNGIRNYVQNYPQEETNGLTKVQIYKEFIKTIVPKIRVLFNLMKKYIIGKLSIVDVVSYLEPFLIYPDDLTYNQYNEIISFLDQKISEYNKSMVEFSRIFKIILTAKKNNPIMSNAFTIIEIINTNLRSEIFETGYGLENPEKTFTNSEILRKLILKDYSRLYTTTIAYQNISLMFPNDINDLFEVEKKQNEKLLSDEEENDNCETITISKMYTSLQQLENDNNKIIYFDKKYDNTNYGVMEEHDEKKGYAKAVINMTPESLKDHIVNDQMKKNGLSEEKAYYLADTLIDGNKKVIDGQHAMLYKGYSENIADQNDYYVRKSNVWVLDKELSQKTGIIDEPSIICDLQNKCVNVSTKNDNNCESIKSNELGLQNMLLNDIISEFDSKYKLSKEEFEKDIKKKYEYFMSIMPLLSKIDTNFLLKYNNQKYKLSSNIDEDSSNKIASPFTQLLNIILGQKDFTKKQNDILKFAEKFTRPSIGVINSNGDLENEHWLYCIKTNVCLLPAFKKELAAAFVMSPYYYQNTLEQIKSSIGQLSDDGDWWTDKHSGWPICPGDFDTEEGFDDGFKVVSRSIMEEDAGNKITSATSEKTIKYITAETITINNIVNALSIAMGINIEPQKEFIINNVIESIKSTVESESDYKDKVKIAATKGKSIPSYKDFFNTSLLFYTLGMYLIAVQTSIPSVKTRKTHPGCIRSFKGYPFEGAGDLSSLSYLACITYDIRSSSEPWNVLKKTNTEKIQTKIKGAIDDILIQLPDVQRKFSEKTEYLLTNPSTEIPEEHDIEKWSDFLPPLIPFKITHLYNISAEFKSSLVSDLRSGSINQREKILVIESKIIQFSLAIQEKIQEIVKKQKVILHTANNEPYLENACCDSIDNESTIDYFINRNNNILEYNTIVGKLNNILDDIRGNTEAVLFYSNINTKNVYPYISNTFDEKTIYLAFIFYCKFKSLIPVPEDLLPICTNKPESILINPSDPIDRIIQKLKEDGRNYTNEQFLRLIQLISRENIINITFDNQIISCVAKLTKLLEAIYDENNDDEIIELSLRDLITNAIDTFDIASSESSKEVKDLNNFLIIHNEEMIDELVDYVGKNSGANVTRSSIKKFTEAIRNLQTWGFDNSNRNEHIKISNDTMYTVTNFYKTFIDNFVNVFPNIILNKVNYDINHIPNYYGFSKTHTYKLQKNISQYFEKLKPFYGISTLTNILTTIQKFGKNLVSLSDSTPCFSSIKNGEQILKGVIDERTSRFLFEYYLLRILITYVSLSDDEKMTVVETKKTTEVTDLFSVDFIEETDTRIDLGFSTTNISNNQILTGNKKELKQKTAELLVSFMEIFISEKDTIDISYEQIQDRVFKLREREKNLVTDRLKSMTDEQRDADTMLKVTKQGLYSKGLEKGLTMYDKDFYEGEQNLRDEMLRAERNIRFKNKNATDENIDILIDEYMEQEKVNKDIDQDAYDLGDLRESFNDGVDINGENEMDYENEYNDYD
jgi:hypothetical protein